MWPIDSQDIRQKILKKKDIVLVLMDIGDGTTTS
jgi:hypothetical protein